MFDKKLLKETIEALKYQYERNGSIIAGRSLTCVEQLKGFAESSMETIGRLRFLLFNSIKAIEEICEGEIIGTDLEDEIGITREEYEMLKSMRF